jgi:hypothetical protein
MEGKKQTAVIKGTNYCIDIDGTLVNLKNGRIKKWTKDNNGYMRSTIWLNGKSITISQHRVLAQCFIENIYFKTQVNHKNGLKHDNRIENLEWVTPSENTIHSFANGLQKPSKPHMKKVIDESTGIVYESLSEASRNLNINRGNLSGMLSGKKKNQTNLKYYE